MTIEQANEYFSSLPEGFAPAEELGAALAADGREGLSVCVAGMGGVSVCVPLGYAVPRC